LELLTFWFVFLVWVAFLGLVPGWLGVGLGGSRKGGKGGKGGCGGKGRGLWTVPYEYGWHTGSVGRSVGELEFENFSFSFSFPPSFPSFLLYCFWIVLSNWFVRRWVEEPLVSFIGVRYRMCACLRVCDTRVTKGREGHGWMDGWMDYRHDHITVLEDHWMQVLTHRR